MSQRGWGSEKCKKSVTYYLNDPKSYITQYLIFLWNLNPIENKRRNARQSGLLESFASDMKTTLKFYNKLQLNELRFVNYSDPSVSPTKLCITY